MKNKKIVSKNEKPLSKVREREFKQPPRKDHPTEDPDSDQDEDLKKFNIKGQDHYEHSRADPPDNSEQEENQEEAYENQNEEEEVNTENKILIDTFPREDYWKQKIEDWNINKSLWRSIDKARLNLKDSIKNEIEIHQVSQDLDWLIPKRETKKKWETKNNQIKSRERLHILNKLKHNQTNLENLLRQSIENAEVLKNHKHVNDNAVKLAKMNEEKDRWINAIDAISTKINSIVFEEERGKYSENKKSKLKDYIDNFERDKEIVETRWLSYENDSRTRIERMQTESEAWMEKRNRDYEENKQRWLDEKEEKWREFREKEKEAILKRTKENNQKLLKIKVFLNERPNQRNYLYWTNEKSYIQKETDMINSVKQAKKEYLQSISQAEFEDYSSKYEEFKQKLIEKQEAVTWRLKQEWKEREEILPKYQNPILSVAESEAHNTSNNIGQRNDLIKDLKEQKHKYAEEVKSKYQPAKNPKLERERTKRIIQIEHKNKPKKFVTITHYKKNIVRLRKRNWNKPTKIHWKLKWDPIRDDNLRSKSPQIKKLKYIKWSGSGSGSVDDGAKANINSKLKAVDKDYVNEKKRLKKIININSANNNNVDSEEKQGINWDKIVNRDNKNSNLLANVNDINMKIERLETKVQRKEQIWKNMGTGMTLVGQKICESMSNLMTEAIKGKLSLLNKIIHNHEM